MLTAKASRNLGHGGNAYFRIVQKFWLINIRHTQGQFALKESNVSNFAPSLSKCNIGVEEAQVTVGKEIGDVRICLPVSSSQFCLYLCTVVGLLIQLNTIWRLDNKEGGKWKGYWWNDCRRLAVIKSICWEVTVLSRFLIQLLVWI